jgi:hypothetical protein
MSFQPQLHDLSLTLQCFSIPPEKRDLLKDSHWERTQRLVMPIFSHDFPQALNKCGSENQGLELAGPSLHPTGRKLVISMALLLGSP